LLEPKKGALEINLHQEVASPLSAGREKSRRRGKGGSHLERLQEARSRATEVALTMFGRIGAGVGSRFTLEPER